MKSPPPRIQSGRSGPKLIVDALSRKYAEIMGQFEVAEQEAEHAHGLAEIIEVGYRIDRFKAELSRHMLALEHVIWLYDGDWKRSQVRPLYPRTTYQKPGTISRAAMRVLKRATRPMTTREIARNVCADLDMKGVDERELARVEGAIIPTLERKLGRFVQVHAGTPRRWSLRRAADVAAMAAAA